MRRMHARRRVMTWPAFGAISTSALAGQAQRAPIPEDPSRAPQVEIDGTAIGTLRGSRDAETPTGAGTIAFADSALLIGAAQRLFDGSSVGSAGVGVVSVDDAALRSGPGYFVDQSFLDYQ